MFFLQKAANLNPFSSNHFAWIDIGITYVPGILIDDQVESTWSELGKIMAQCPNNIKVGCMCETSSEELDNRKEFYQVRQCKLIGGFIHIKSDYIDKLADWFQHELDQAFLNE